MNDVGKAKNRVEEIFVGEFLKIIPECGIKRAIQIFFVIWGVFFAAGSMAHSCDIPLLQTFFNAAASTAESMVLPEDRAIVLEAVSSYPEGSEPPGFTAGANDEPVLEMPSRAAAFFMAGVEAVTLDNKLVAGWCFLEASKRNPQEPNFLNNTAFILMQYDLYPTAKMILECVRTIAPGYTPAHVNMGYTLDRLSSPMEAAMSYLTAYMKHPDNGDYLYLTVHEFARAGNTDIAARLALTGSNSYSEDYDWDSIMELNDGAFRRRSQDTLSVHKPDALRTACSSEQDNIYTQLRNELDERLRRLSQSMDLSGVTGMNIDLECEQCRKVWQDMSGKCCAATHSQFCDRCECSYLTREQLCLVDKAEAWYRHALTTAAITYHHCSRAAAVVTSMAEGNRDILCERHYNLFLNEAEGWRRCSGDPYLFDFSYEKSYISDEIANYRDAVSFYCDNLGPDTVWVPYVEIRDPKISTNEEINQCLSPGVPICAHINVLSGTPALSASIFGFSGKLSRDPVSGDANLSVGISNSYGAMGSGAGITLQYNVNQVEITSKLSMGGMDVECAFGFARFDAPTDLPPPPEVPDP